MARQKIALLRAELRTGCYFDVLLPLPMSRKERRAVASELEKMAEEIRSGETRFPPASPTDVLEVIADLVCDDDGEGPDEEDEDEDDEDR